MGTDSIAYRLLRDWVADGVRPDPPDTPALVGLVVTPPARILDDPAHDATARGPGALRRRVDPRRDPPGPLQLDRHRDRPASTTKDSSSSRSGERRRSWSPYEHLVATSRLVFREPVPGLVWADPPANNFIDEHVFAKLKLLRIPPSELSGDAMFCRRVYLDLIGLVPTPEERRRVPPGPSCRQAARLIDCAARGGPSTSTSGR